MDEIVNDLSSQALLPALERNMVEYFVAWGRGAGNEIYEGEDFARYCTGIPYGIFNGILHARLAPESVDPVIEQNLAYIMSKDVPFNWWVGPSTQPSNLGICLEQNGFAHEDDELGMAVDLLNMNDDLAVPENFTYKTSDDLDFLRTWDRLVWKGFELPEEGLLKAKDLDASLRGNPKRQRFIGYVNWVPVATSALVLYAGVAGIYSVSTLPEARRRGFGAAITLAPLLAARDMGYRVATLQASPMGYPVYRRIGFKEVCHVSTYRSPKEV